RIGFTGEHGGHPGHMWMVAAEAGHPLIQLACHAWFVRILERYKMTDTTCKEKVNHLRGLQLVADRPGVAFKPRPDRLEQAVGKHMYMRINHGWEVSGQVSSLRVVEGWSRSPRMQKV